MKLAQPMMGLLSVFYLSSNAIINPAAFSFILISHLLITAANLFPLSYLKFAFLKIEFTLIFHYLI
jgi:hypothetical protein